MAKRGERYIVYCKKAVLTYANTTAIKLFTLPENSIPIGVDVFTATTATSGTIDVGTLANDDLFIAALDVSVLGMSPGTLLSNAELTKMTDIFGLQAGASSGGPFTIFMRYINLRTTRVV